MDTPQVVVDSHQLTKLRQWLVQNNKTAARFKGIMKCGTGVIKQKGNSSLVYVISNNQNSARFHGTTTCRNPWFCPVCAPKVMAARSTDIACAIDALKTWHHQSACMITLTIPHTKDMSCKDTFNILQTAWRKFTRENNANYLSKYKLKSTGEVKYYKKDRGAYANFKCDLQIVHHIKTWEFTYGDNGFHPHMHILYWVPDKLFNKIKDYEEKLLDKWWYEIKKETLRYYAAKGVDTTKIEKHFDDNHKYPKDGHRSLYISKDNQGNIRKVTSSHYLAGWQSDIEMSRGMEYKKAGHGIEGHYAMHQILQKAIDEPDKADFWFHLYLDYMCTVQGRRRMEFSKRGGIHQIIEQWKRSNTYVQRLKKKIQENRISNQKHVVIWFTEQQWLQICFHDLYNNADLKTRILALAAYHGKLARDFIITMLLEYDIDTSENSMDIDEVRCLEERFKLRYQFAA